MMRHMFRRYCNNCVIREEGQDKEEILVTGRNVAITGKEIEITADAEDRRDRGVGASLRTINMIEYTK